jgi:hypothetical protein
LNLEKTPIVIPQNVQQIPIVVNQGELIDRLVNVVLSFLFTKSQNLDPNNHLAKFMVACIANNAKANENLKMIFPKTLKDLAFQWYNLVKHMELFQVGSF